MIFDKMQEKYCSSPMQMLTADGKAIDFYKKMALNARDKRSRCGFTKGSNINLKDSLAVIKK